MTAEAALAVRSWSVGPFTCVLTVQRPKRGALVHAVCEWTPRVPTRLTDAEWHDYTAGRNQALYDIACAMGVSVGALDT